MAEDPTRKLDKGRRTDKQLVSQAVSQLEQNPVPDTGPVPEAPQDLVAEQPKRGFFYLVLSAISVPLACGVGAALLIWARYWPPLPGLLPGWLGWCVLACVLPLLARRPLALALFGAFSGIPVLLLTLSMNFKVVRVEGESMAPTLAPGDVLLVDLKGNPSEFALPGREIYVLDLENERDHPLIKRLVGTPGQDLVIRDGRLYAGGERVFPVSDKLNSPRLEYRGHLQANAKLNDDQYFFLGDNPDNSRDGRNFGAVSSKNVEGRVVWRLKGPNGFGRIE